MVDLSNLEQEGEDEAKQLAKKEADQKLGADNQQGQNQQGEQQNQ